MVNTKLQRTYSLTDILFAGYGYIIGAGIFTLLPFIIKYAKGNTWLAFVLGGAISILTGLSYAKLNLDLPSNDAEYVWIIESFTTKKDREEKTTFYKNVKRFAKIVIYSVMALGIAMNATVAVSIVEFLKPYLPQISSVILSFFVILIPSLVNMTSAKYTAKLNIGITSITTLGLVVVILLGLFSSKKTGENTVIPISGNTANLLRSVFITIFAYNGFQSIVQMSEEAKIKSDIPKGMIGSVSIATIFYSLIAISVISLFGIKKASTSLSPIVDAYGLTFGNKAQHLVNILAILTMSTTLLLSIMSRSRLLKKLADKQLAPAILSKLTPVMGNKMPVNAVVIIAVLSYMSTFVKNNALEMLANIANTIAFFIFSCINIAVVYKYHKDKREKRENNNKENDEEVNNNANEEEELEPIMKKFKNAYPYYGILGAIFTTAFFIKSPQFYKIK